MKKANAFALMLLLILLPLVQTVRSQTPSADSARVAKVKSEVTKRLANKKTRVKLKLHDGSQVKGRLEQATDDSFSLTEDKTHRTIDIKYAEVDKVSGRGMSTLAKVGIVAAVGVAVLAVVVIVALKNFDPFEGGIVPR
jgi:hypothetical protein